MAYNNTSNQAVEVRQVWKYNLEQEFMLIRHFATRCSYVAIDTEFPGVLYEAPTHPFSMAPEERYALMKSNVDKLKLIQLGLTLSTGGICVVWEFNFQFNPMEDAHSAGSLQWLKSHGHNLWNSYYHGINPQRFAELMWCSGLLCGESKIWIGFHMSSDIGYLIKILTGQDLPGSLKSFEQIVERYLGSRVFDVKHLCQTRSLYGGLDRVSEALTVSRAAGCPHHAGSDSLLIWDTYRSAVARFYADGSGMIWESGIMFGIHTV